VNHPTCACTDFSRTALVKRAVAQAGDGLPAIEPGMPLPPGTGLTRRSFLSRSLGLALSVYGAEMLAPRALEDGIARALAGGPPDAVLVSVYLGGGYDALSVLYPTADPLYRKLRPKLALSPDAGLPFAEDDRLQWHPALEPFAKLHEQGKLTVLEQYGYLNANQSHFTSVGYMWNGSTNHKLLSGWMGRYLDAHGSPDNPLQAVSFDGYLDPSIAPERHDRPVAALDGAYFPLSIPNVWGKVEARVHETMSELGSTNWRDPNRNVAGRVMNQSRQLLDQMAPFGDGSGLKPPVAYPADDEGDFFPQKLAGLAAMISSGLPVRCVAVTAPGLYDTHDSQPEYLDAGLRKTAATLEAFQRDLEARGVADRVLTLVWSEFGRRAEENASNGTDHGAAGTAFLIGKRVRGQMIGEFTGLNDLDELGNLKPVVDFRGVYCALLEQWFGVDAAQIIPEAAKFARPEFLS
jgi:uncharacterized protein (DUF1501 family)